MPQNWSDMLLGESKTPSALSPKPSGKKTNWSDMLLDERPPSPSPFGEIRSADPQFMDSPTANVSPISDSSKMAGVKTQAVASLPTDLRERAAYFANQRFPQDPNAISRYGIQDGKIFYQGDDGKFYFEEPGISQPGKFAASLAGPSLPFAGAVGGGAATSFMGGVPGAAAGAASGDALRQLAAMSLAAQQQYDPWQTGGEGLLGAAGQGVGALGIKWSNRLAAKDLARTKTPEAKAAIDRLTEASQKEGISLTPAEITNLRSLKAQQNTLGDLPRSGDTLDEFYQVRNEQQIPNAVNRMLDNISPTKSAELGARNLQRGAEETIGAAREVRKNASQDLYTAVFPKKIPLTHFKSVARINPIVRNAIKGSKNDEVVQYYIAKYERETGQKITQNSVGFLDAVKQSIDGKAEAALRNGETKRANAYTSSAKELREKIDRIVPGYEDARSAYAGESPAVTALEEGEVGLAANAKLTGVDAAPSKLFDTGPEAVASNRAAFVKAGKEKEWNDGLRSYLQQSFDKASKEYATGKVAPGSKFRSLVFGTPKQKAAIKSAMSSEQWGGFNRLMDVLEAAGRSEKGGSRTAFAGEGIQAMRREAAPLMDIARAPQTWLQRTWQDWRFGNYSEKLADIITSPDAMKQLKQLKKWSPRSQQAAKIAAQVLVRGGIGKAEDWMEMDVKPGEMQPSR